LLLMLYVRLIIIILIISLATKKTSAQSVSLNDVPQSIPLKKYRHMFYIEVIINNKKANLLVDTGAAYSLFDVTQAKKYGFLFIDSDVELVGLGGKRKRYYLKNCKVHHEQSPILLAPYGADMKDLVHSFSDNGLEILGIIGSDYFTMAKAVIDYKDKKLLLNWDM